jgi:hypothetical protein
MAGNLAAFTNYLTNTLALPANVTDAVVQQGYASFDDMDYLEDDDIDRLCMAIRRPGGQIATAAGVMRNDPGVAIGQMYQSRLKQLAYYIKYTRLSSNIFTAAQATLARLRAAYAYKKTADQKVKDGNPDMPETFTTAKRVVGGCRRSLTKCSLCRTTPHCVGTRIRGTTRSYRHNCQCPVWPQKCRLCLAHHVGTDPS